MSHANILGDSNQISGFTNPVMTPLYIKPCGCLIDPFEVPDDSEPTAYYEITRRQRHPSLFCPNNHPSWSMLVRPLGVPTVISSTRGRYPALI